MMKKTNLLLFLFLLPLIMMGQEEKKFTIDFSGYMKNDVVFNTRQVISARGESQFLLAPKEVELDANGEDVNASPNFNIINIETRFRAKIKAPDAFGAKTSGLIEGDFFGTTAATKFNFRMRHAFVKLDWKKSNLLIGQYWHPMFITSCYASTVSFGAGVPFNPLSRVAQLRYSYNVSDKFSAFAAVLGRGHFGGPAGNPAYQNAAMPELHAQIQYKSDKFLVGAGVNYQLLKPSLTTTGVDTGGNPISLVSEATIGSLSFIGFMSYKTKPLTVKLWGMYGQNNDNLVMMGGFAPVYDTTYTAQQISEGYVEYAAYDNLSAWIDLSTNGEKTQFGLFAGYAKNMGAKTDVDISSYVGRWGNVNSMLRVAPRIVFLSGSSKIGIEVEYSAVDYASPINENGTTLTETTGINQHGEVVNFTTADNLKFLVSYCFNF
jgi:hypothetical protein